MAIASALPNVELSIGTLSTTPLNVEMSIAEMKDTFRVSLVDTRFLRCNVNFYSVGTRVFEL